MKQLDSNALGLVDRALGLAGPGSQQTELEDGLVAQTLDVTNLVARSRSPIQHGQKWAIIQNVHSTTSDALTAVDPYFIPGGAAPLVAPYGVQWNWPDPVPLGFDIWYLGCVTQVVTGTGFTEGYFGMVGGQVPAGAFGYTHSGIGITASTIRYPLQSWSGEALVGGILFGTAIASSQQVFATGQRGVRIPRGTTLEFRSRSSAAITVQAMPLLGLFPQALGQDVIT